MGLHTYPPSAWRKLGIPASDYRAWLTSELSDGVTAAWYQPGVGVTGTLNASLWANWVNGTAGTAADLAQATGANQPIYLSHTGANYAYLPAVAGNYVSTPDSVAASITGDIDIRAYVALNDWTPSADSMIVTKYEGVGVSYALRVNTTGTLSLFWSLLGAVDTEKTSTAATGFTDATLHWIRATLDVDNGAGGNDVKFYTSDDGTTWTQLGTTVTTAGTTSIFDSISIVRIGQLYTDAQFLIGKVYRVQIYNGIGGTLAMDFNAADWPETATNGATQVSSTTGETWTLNNTGVVKAQIVGSPQLLFNGVAHSLKSSAYTLNQPITDYIVFKQNSWTNGEYIFDGNTAGAYLLYQQGTTPGIRFNVGLEPFENTGLAVGAYGIVTTVGNGASGSQKVNNNAAQVGNFGAANAGGGTLGGRADGVNLSNIQVKEWIRRAAADSAATQLRIIDLLNRLHSVY